MDMTSSGNGEILTGSDELLSLCSEISERSPWLGLDTEFLRERTYFAKLCLVQIGIEGSEYALDVLALESLDPLTELLASPIPKVLHAARQDFEVLYQACGLLPEHVFDTQLAAAFCGYPDQVGYAGLVEGEFGVHLDKQHARTDWSRRPLSPAQVDYALKDVLYLGELYSILSSRLVEKGRLDWFEEEIQLLGDTGLYDIDPQDSFLRVKGAGRLTGIARSNLRALAAWRENTARDRDLPRSWVLTDANLVALSHLNPQSIDQLRDYQDLKPGSLRRYGKELIEVIGTASHGDNSDDFPAPGRSLTSSERKHGSGLMKIVSDRAEELDIASALLATRRDVEALVRADVDGVDPGSCKLLRGWRRDTIGTLLLT